MNNGRRYSAEVRAEAARLRAEEYLTLDAICARLGCSSDAASRWTRHIKFRRPTRFVALPRSRGQVQARITSRVIVDAAGCWLWQGRRDYEGYPLIKNDYGMIRRAHRLAYKAFVGAIPDDLPLDHLCSVRHCVNPAHLEAVDQRTNVLRGKTIPAANIAKTHCKRGHPLSGKNLVVVKGASGRLCRNCRACRNTHQRKRNARRGRK